MSITTKMTEWAGDAQKWLQDVAADPRSLVGDVFPEEFYLATEKEQKTTTTPEQEGIHIGPKVELSDQESTPSQQKDPSKYHLPTTEELQKCRRYLHDIPVEPTKPKRSKPKQPPAPKQEECGGVKDQQDYEAQKTELDNAVNPALDSFKMAEEALIKERDRPLKHLYHPLLAFFDFSKKALQQPELQKSIDALEAAQKTLEESRQKALEELQKKHCLK